MIAPQSNLTREEWRALGIGALGAAFGAIVTEGVRFAFSELERVLKERREAARKDDEEKP